MLKLFALAPLAFSLSAFAADGDTDQAMLLSPTPPASVADAPATSSPVSKRLSLGLGTGVNSFGGNMGQLYGTSSPVVDLRGEWKFSSAFTARAGVDFAKYSFNAAPSGAVDVSANSISAAGQWHFLNTAMSGGGFDPYASAGVAQVFRSQTFQDHNTVEKDNAFAAGAGIGTNYLPNGARLGFWVEANASQIFFQDRFSSQFLESGLADQTGLLYSGRVGMKYVF